MSEEKELDFDSWLERFLVVPDNVFDASFELGYTLGKWEATRWKYKKPEDAEKHFDEYREHYGSQSEAMSFYMGFKLARELETGE